ncbi:hypothetical protein [Streptosporangium carneum]|uniref:Uncharacterized protein n=1 Tax=Streptosporangium carneum TaxID=47481 RepID=A0A9W6MBR8_9ACTN|nr:hypothetical protein [Streptosporangium carneum]GLK07963.1 hypothetical protein GCM10017600_13680 [Streptosporangium carneum]
MVTSKSLEQFDHLVRLGRNLHRIGVGSTLVLPVAGQPILEVVSMGRTRIRVVVTRRAREWVFVWRPWWARIWTPGSWVWAEADNAADIIAVAAAA